MLWQQHLGRWWGCLPSLGVGLSTVSRGYWEHKGLAILWMERNREKNQTLMFIVKRRTVSEMVEMRDISLCGYFQTIMVLLTALKYCSRIHPPEKHRCIPWIVGGANILNKVWSRSCFLNCAPFKYLPSGRLLCNPYSLIGEPVEAGDLMFNTSS